MDYTKPERQRVEDVHVLMKNLGDIPYAEMGRFLNEGLVHGNLTSTDVTNAEDIYGPVIGAVKGKTKARGPVSTPHEEKVLAPRSH